MGMGGDGDDKCEVGIVINPNDEGCDGYKICTDVWGGDISCFPLCSPQLHRL